MIALVLLAAVVGAGVVLAGGALLQDDGDADGAPDDATVAQENQTVDTERVNVTVQLEPTDGREDDLRYELVVVGEIAAANDAANGTVDCTGELCVVDGSLAADAAGEDLPRYELRGVVTSASPAEGYTANVTGTLEGDAIEGLGLGAYNVTGPDGTDATNDSVVAMGGAGGGAITDVNVEGATADAEALRADGGTTDSGSTDAGPSETDDADGESPSVTFDGCSSATVEGDAYAYEAGLRYYVPSGLDTSTIDESEISTPTTVDGNDLIGDGRTTDVVVETVLVLDEDFGVVTQASNPNYEDCVDEIEQQHADWEDEQADDGTVDGSDSNATE